MAKRTLALFDVDGTLTVPRKVRLCGMLFGSGRGCLRGAAHRSWLTVCV
jgi:hypothetical protein